MNRIAPQNISAAPVQSIDRVLDIIEILSAAPEGLSIRELSQMTGLHSSTVHRLLHCLVNRSYARKEMYTNKYCLTLRFLEIGGRLSGSFDLVAIAKDRLNALSNYVGEVVHLVQRDGPYVTYLYKVEPGTMLMSMGSRVGSCNPLYCTGVGKCILAFLPEHNVDGIWNASDIRAITPNTITDLNVLKQSLAVIRETGYATDNEENEVGVYCIACPIFNYVGDPVAAVSVSTRASRVTPEFKKDTIERLLAVTADISLQLGYNGKRKGD